MIKESEIRNNRIRYVDIATGIMLIWMMVGHAFFHAQHTDAFWDYRIYLGFFMPWFFFKSGMFFSTKNQRLLFRKDYAKLVIPFVVWAFVGTFVLDGILLIEGEPSLKPYFYSPIRSFFMNAHVMGNGSVWFLWSLFLVHQIANCGLKKVHPSVLALIGIVVAYTLYRANFTYTPRWIMNTSSGLFFFCIGYWLKDYPVRWWMVLIAGIAYAVFCHVGYPMVHMYTNTVMTGNYLLWYPASICGIVLLEGGAMCLECCIPDSYLVRGLEYLSKNAMNYYLSHWIVLMVFVRMLAKDILGINDTQSLLWIGLATIAFLMPLVNCLMNTETYKKTKLFIDYLLTPKKWQR